MQISYLDTYCEPGKCGSFINPLVCACSPGVRRIGGPGELSGQPGTQAAGGMQAAGQSAGGQHAQV